MAPTQPTFADLELQGARRKTRKAAFLEELDRAVPWGRLLALLAPAYPEGRRGRPPVGAEPMLRMYLLAVCYDLSDQAAEDEVADSAAARAFVGRAGADAPDATTLCRFRHLLEDNGLGEAVLAEVNAALAERGAAVSRGTIADATFVEAPVSTKNREGARDPEAHQGKKGNNWHFGYKAHMGVDADTGLVHTVDVTAANASDVARAFALVRPGDGGPGPTPATPAWPGGPRWPPTPRSPGWCGAWPRRGRRSPRPTAPSRGPCRACAPGSSTPSTSSRTSSA